MAEALDGVRLKIARAREHFAELAAESDAFFQADPYELISHFDPDRSDDPQESDRGARVFRLVARKEIPPRLGILIGEVVQQLRSSLDHIAWQLSLLTTNTPPPSTEFPVYKDETGDRGYLANRTRKIGAIPAKAQAVIDGMQPRLQPTPEADPLWVLHRLANDDKHRLPNLVAAIPHGIRVAQLDGVGLFASLRYGPFNNETEVATLTIYPPHDPDMEVPVAVTDIALCFDTEGPGRGRSQPLLSSMSVGAVSTPR